MFGSVRFGFKFLFGSKLYKALLDSLVEDMLKKPLVLEPNLWRTCAEWKRFWACLASKGAGGLTAAEAAELKPEELAVLESQKGVLVRA